MLGEEDSFDLEEQLVKKLREHIERIKQENQGCTLKQILLVVKNVPMFKQVDDSTIKEVFESL